MASASNSACASTSTSTIDDNACYQYQVFLNHRGPDVKKTFATQLYKRLTEHGLLVFLDKEEMQKGEKITCQIERAIRTASVQIAIFSSTYAHSNWCLDELVLMLESMREKRSTILPVFFRVKPSELRWTDGEKGVYAEGLRSLQNKRTVDSLQPRYDSNTIGNWKKALYEVAEISGFELEEGPYNGDEEKLVADVVERVLQIVPKTLDVSKFPTGLRDKFKDFEERVLLQQHESGQARVVGIWGSGGVGKTTLAKELFNRETSKYRRSSFLFDVRENHRRGSLKSLQSILIKDLIQQHVQINSTDEGKEKLRKHLSSSQALIIIDDADHIDQLDALISPIIGVLASSSLIVVTTRNMDVLTSWGIDKLFIYELKGLDPHNSTELFCWHAFRQPRPVAEFEHVVNKFLVACNGLPLSLKVIGALLYGKKIEYWEAQFRKISKILPKDIHETLKISYDSLDEEEKQMFLDTACFFIGEEKETAIKIWDGSGWEGSLGFQNLQAKCLLEVEDRKVWDEYRKSLLGECIRMHDHVRDLGRSLAVTEPGRRIWRVTEMVLKGRQVTINLPDQSQRDQSPPFKSPVREIKESGECDYLVSNSGERNYLVSNSGERDHVVSELTSQEGSCVERVFSVVQPTQLLMLRWYNCPDDSLPPQFSTEKLRILYIRGEKLQTPWHQAPLELRELHIIAADMLFKIPESIGQLKHLEKIVLRGYNSHFGLPLEQLPDEFCALTSLKHLELNSCEYLSSLPDSFGKLTSLQYVQFCSCRRLERLPDTFGDLIELKHVNFNCCLELEMLPDSFGSLTKLQHIDLSYVWKLQMLPKSFENLIQLKYLDLTGCQQLTLSSNTLGKITTLEVFRLSGCKNNEVMPPQLTYQRLLQKLHLGFDFKELPSDIGKLSNLKILYLESSCLETLPPSFGDLRSLEELELVSCPLKCFPDSTRMLTRLKKLSIGRIKNLEVLEIETTTDLRGRGTCEACYSNAVFPNLQHLHIQNCHRLVEVGALRTGLQHLQIKHCDGLLEVGALPTTLQRLEIEWCRGLEELTFIKTLVCLEDLVVWSCHTLKRIHGLGQLIKLQRLGLYECREIEEVAGVEHSRSLKSFSAESCAKLKREYMTLQSTCEYFYWNKN